MRFFLGFIVSIFCFQSAFAAGYVASNERPPAFPREFRGAWVACVYNIDWPSKPGLSAATQKAELRRLLDRAAQYRLNAIIFQVRPNADAVYNSRIEPYSHWISGRMGKSSGYDPLAYCISEAHRRGIEVHAWFNPFRALPNATIPTSGNHITRTHTGVVKRFRNYKWMDPSSPFARQRALSVILDVARRYDVDGIHIDDYFYPYPEVHKNGRPKQIFPDGKSPATRRAFVDNFVKQLYTSVKQTKPWLRVGISPFGIWRPGVPRGTTANINAYEHLSADSRKWLVNGWCDYMSPQLYWRIRPQAQSYSALLGWWRDQSESSKFKRPVWPGIATDRVMSKTDPGRPASEILNQVNLSRTVGRNWAGHCHWSMKSLMQNRGGVTTALVKGAYAQPALVPPMPWMGVRPPKTPNAKVTMYRGHVIANWTRVPSVSKYAVQARYGNVWYAMAASYGTSLKISGQPAAVAISAVDRYGNTSAPRVLSWR